jgi:flagellar hook-associated protein 2
MASGVDTDEIIKKLVQVESRPIMQWEQEKKTANAKKQALGTLKGHVSTLQDSVKDLYGFRSSYFDRAVTSSDPGAVEATAGRNATKGSNTIIVRELASTHKISTEPVKKGQELESGKIILTVNGETRNIRFRGGKIAALDDVISEEASDIVNTTLMNTEGDLFTLTLESKIPGTKGEILISGDKSTLNSIGLIKGEKGSDPKKVELVYDQKYFTGYTGSEKTAEQNGKLFVEKEGRGVKLTGTLWREYVMPMGLDIKENSTLEFEFAYAEKRTPAEEALPFRIEIGPEEKTVIKGIELQGYNVPRIRPLEDKKEKDQFTTLTGVGVISGANGNRLEKIYSIDAKSKGKQEIPIGRDFKDRKIEKIIFYCNEGDASFSNTAILTPEKGTGYFEPKNVISKSKNARITVNGIDIVRDKNTGISDAVKGITLNLKRASEHPVTLTVEADAKKAIDKIKKFIESYNAYLDYTSELTFVERVSKSGPSSRSTPKTGLFLGDMTILRLENTIKTAVNSAYPSKSEEPIKILQQLGITTGALNAEWDTIKTGKLTLDEDKFTTVLVANPDGVKEFFGSDTDGDTRIDNGFAYKLQQILKPYTMSGKNILQAKIDYEIDAIKLSDDRISKHQNHLVQYEDKLRRKFSAMERAISGTKAQGNWLKQNMGGGQGDSNSK